MKTLLTILFVFTTALSGIGTIYYNPDQLHGRWEHEYKLENGVIIAGTTHYRENGTYTDKSTILSSGSVVDEFQIEGTWKLEKNIIYYTGRIVAPSEKIQDLEPLTAELVKITEDKYYFKAMDGTIQFETRIKKD